MKKIKRVNARGYIGVGAGKGAGLATAARVTMEDLTEEVRFDLKLE